MRTRILVAVALVGLIPLSSTYAQTTDFFDLVKTGTVQNIQAAINKGANVRAQDKYGETPLMWAAGFNPNPEVITALLNAGADAKAKNKAPPDKRIRHAFRWHFILTAHLDGGVYDV